MGPLEADDDPAVGLDGDGRGPAAAEQDVAALAEARVDGAVRLVAHDRDAAPGPSGREDGAAGLERGRENVVGPARVEVSRHLPAVAERRIQRAGGRVAGEGEPSRRLAEGDDSAVRLKQRGVRRVGGARLGCHGSAARAGEREHDQGTRQSASDPASELPRTSSIDQEEASSVRASRITAAPGAISWERRPSRSLQPGWISIARRTSATPRSTSP